MIIYLERGVVRRVRRANPWTIEDHRRLLDPLCPAPPPHLCLLLPCPQPLSLFGFDSAGFVAMSRVMGDWVGKDVSPIILYKHPTIRGLAGFLARGANEAELSALPSDDQVSHRFPWFTGGETA